MKDNLRLQNSPAEAARLREFVATFASLRGLSETDRARLLVILDELFANVVTHGYSGVHSAGHIDISLSLKYDRLIIEFVDDGRPFDPLAVPPAELDLPIASRPIGGVGIAIVRALVDDIGYTRVADRNRLTLVQTVDRPSGDPPR